MLRSRCTRYGRQELFVGFGGGGGERYGGANFKLMLLVAVENCGKNHLTVVGLLIVM